MAKTLISEIVKVSNSIKMERSHHDVLAALVEEVGELATEIAIDAGKKKRKPSPDGIVGEALDTIINAVDIVNRELKKSGDVSPSKVEALLLERAEKKLAKWKAKDGTTPPAK